VPKVIVKGRIVHVSEPLLERVQRWWFVLIRRCDFRYDPWCDRCAYEELKWWWPPPSPRYTPDENITDISHANRRKDHRMDREWWLLRHPLWSKIHSTDDTVLIFVLSTLLQFWTIHDQSVVTHIACFVQVPSIPWDGGIGNQYENLNICSSMVSFTRKRRQTCVCPTFLLMLGGEWVQEDGMVQSD